MYFLFFVISLFQILNPVQSSKSMQPIKSINMIELTNDNFVSLRGPVTSTSIAELITHLIEKTSDIRYIYLNTNGGSVTAGLKLINVINDLENIGVEVNCIADTAISMGFVIFQSCTNRYVLSHSTLMQHQMSLNGVGGKLLEINSYMSYINNIEDELNGLQAERINISQTEFENKISNDWWLTTSEAIRLNVADKIIQIKCNFKNEKEFVIINSIFGDIELIYMKCPQVATPVKINFKLNDSVNNSVNEHEIKNIIDSNYVKLDKINLNTKTPRYLDMFVDIIGNI
jgi:ATP-dependent Clp protease protease subunit